MASRIDISIIIVGIVLLVVGLTVGDSAAGICAVGVIALIVGVVSRAFSRATRNAPREIVVGGLIIGAVALVGGTLWQAFNPDGILTVYVAPIGMGLVLAAAMTLGGRSRTAGGAT